MFPNTKLRTHIPLALTILAFSASISMAQDALEIVDPTNGETVSLSDLDYAALTRSEQRDVRGQLRDQGLSRRDARDAIATAIDVVDPITGETVALSDIDRDALTDEQRADVRGQLSEQGLRPGRGGERDSAEARPERDGEGPGRGGRGGPGGGDRGGRGGPGDATE